MNAVLVGNYGVDNLGDEVLREYFLRAFPEVSWKVVSARPRRANEVNRLPFGIRSLFRPWWNTVGAIARSDAVVFGGGSLFTDVESLKAPKMWRIYAVLARLFRVPVHFAFQGVGPFKTQKAEDMTRTVLEGAASISVRDEGSLSRIQSWKISTPTLAFDPAYKVFSEVAPVPSGRRLVLIPRSNSTEGFMRAAEKQLEGEWDDIVILLMQESEADRAHAERLNKIVNHASVSLRVPKTVEEFLTELSHASFVLSERFHGALAALAMNIPYQAMPQQSGDKLDALSSLPDKETILRRIEDGEKALKEALQ